MVSPNSRGGREKGSFRKHILGNFGENAYWELQSFCARFLAHLPANQGENTRLFVTNLARLSFVLFEKQSFEFTWICPA
jgi:hypothetical protein